LHLGPLVKGLAWLIVLVCLKVGIAHGTDVLSLSLGAVGGILGFLFGASGPVIGHTIVVAALQLLVLLLVYTAFAIGLKKNPWPVYRAIFRMHWRLTVWLVKASFVIFRLLRRLAEGPPPRARRDQREPARSLDSHSENRL